MKIKKKVFFVTLHTSNFYNRNYLLFVDGSEIEFKRGMA